MGRGSLDLPKRVKTWVKTFRKHLTATLKAHEHELWYQVVSSLVSQWSCLQDSNYTRADRWRDFLMLNTHSPYLSYKVGVKNESQMNLSNMFDLLDADFHDQRNPIASLISTFVTMYIKEFSEAVEQTVKSRDVEQAANQLIPLSTLILKFRAVLASTTIVLYSTISIPLSQHMRDLEDLILAHILKGGFNRMIEGLAIAVKQPAIERLQALRRTNPTLEELKVNSEYVNPAIEVATQEAKGCLSAFSSVENIHERRRLLQQVSDNLSKTTDSLGIRRNIVTLAIVKCNADFLPAQLYAAKLFLTDGPDSLDTVLLAIEELTN